MEHRRPLGYLELLRYHADFRRLWSSDVVSQLGDWFNTIAIYVAVQAMTDSAQALAAVFAAKTLPTLIVAPIAGPLADRYDRRMILIWADIARAFAVVGLIVAHHQQSFLGLIAGLIVICVGSGIATPARNAAVPALVLRVDLPAANALEAATWSVMLAVGAALGGVATEWFGATTALTIDMTTFIIAALIATRLPRMAPAAVTKGASVSLTAGLRYLRTNVDVLTLTMLKPMMSLGSAMIVLLPVLALKLDPTTTALTIGFLYTARGLGALIGSLAPRALFGDGDRMMRRTTWLGFLAMAMGATAIAWSESTAVTLAALFFLSIGSGAVWTFSTTLLATTADAQFHGRIFAVEHGLMTLVFSTVGWVLAAVVDAGYGVDRAIAIAAMALLVPLLVWGSRLVRVHPTRFASAL